MRVLIALTIAWSLIAGSSCEVSAKGYSKAHHRHAKPYYRQARPKYPDSSGWYPHDASKLTFGSAIWWDQMRRERRLGGAH
jgi:hypothetical protein